MNFYDKSVSDYMKKYFLTFTITLIALICFAFSSAAIQKKEYIIPLRESAPVIDGIGSDAEWEDAKIIYLSTEDCLQNGGYVQFPETTDGAKAELSVIWSNQEDREGLYFRWIVDDPTQSFAVDKTSNQLNSMDCVQVVIDPMHKQYASIKNCAMCFTFVPYTSISGNGSVPSEPAAWWEHWVWAGAISNADVQVAAKLDKIEDTQGDREWLVFGYVIEAYIPWKALDINHDIPEGIIGENLGIGFSLVDYNLDMNSYIPQFPDGSQKLINVCTDFGNGTDKFNSPKYYNNAYLGNTQGTLTENEKESDVLKDAEKAYQALQTEISNANANYINNTNAQNKYTTVSMTALKNAVAYAEQLSITNSLTELVDARDKIANAVAYLVPIQQDTLEMYISRAEGLIKEKYTQQSWDNLVSALNEAKLHINEPESSAAQSAKKALADAIANLVLTEAENIIGKEELDLLRGQLDTFIISTQNYIESNYSPETWAVFSAARENAKAVLSREDTTQEELQQALDTLKSANSSLYKITNTPVPQSVLPEIITMIFVSVLTIGIVLILIFTKRNRSFAKKL